jgi:hypothetical protein
VIIAGIKMNIKHYPITDISQVEQFYSEKDGVPVKHVCTTEFHDAIADVFYRETPHPEFGNKYFAVLFRNYKPYIANADQVEDLSFGMVENDDGDLEYSQDRHDYKSFKNGNMIDGGRDYIRSSGKVKVFVVRNGRMTHYGANDESYI